MKSNLLKRTRGSNGHKPQHSNFRAFVFLAGIFSCLIFVASSLGYSISFGNPIVSAYVGSEDIYPTMTPTKTPAPTPTITKNQLSAKEKLVLRTLEEFGSEHIDAMYKLIEKESNHNPHATNPSSGACGMFQAFPCEKMQCQQGDEDCQIEWGINYIKNRYGNPTKAWKFWQSRKPINGQDVGNWY